MGGEGALGQMACGADKQHRAGLGCRLGRLLLTCRKADVHTLLEV